MQQKQVAKVPSAAIYWEINPCWDSMLSSIEYSNFPRMFQQYITVLEYSEQNLFLTNEGWT
jgi:hypothetical protein